ncbi:hypothetical protein BK133_21320 [Paenibacillus sp. FSL H8-0548]|uniref:phage/plasmid replication domain-containing protein n=1 Tax=Paenibacillus sp. FSL H8-0548 TaxID=1920422 RepID=UPI00096FFE07|nr:phage/plasmid replication protein [Paenibacillus sp. FSL H8-0548]OMF25634.1 hypothetical protein BK133_21320 [Paenibacillus sp. FSL H8-0548]
MIHTARLFIQLSEVDISNLKKKFKEDMVLTSVKIDSQYDGIFDTDIIKKFNSWWLFTTIDVVKLFNRGEILENDIGAIQRRLDDYLFFVFNLNDKEFTLCRIDYRLDVRISDEVERIVLIDMYKQSVERFGFKVKNVNFATTVYYNSKSITLIIYDKETEREDKHEEIKVYEKNVLRLEVRILNRHLNYMKRQYGLSKILENYFKKDFWEKYMKENVSPIFRKGNFYTLIQASKIIGNSSLKEREKTNLKEFLKNVSKYGINGIHLLKMRSKKYKLKPKYSEYLIRQNLRMLEALMINPISISEYDSVILGRSQGIINPFKF